MKRFLRSKLIFSFVIVLLLAGAIFGTLAGNIFRAHAQAPGTITLSPTQGPRGTVVTVTGSGWTPGHVIDINLEPSVVVLVRATVTSDGTFKTTFTVPSNATVGSFTVIADDETTHGTAQKPFTVTPTPTTVCERFGIPLAPGPCPEGLATEKELIKEFGCTALFVPIEFIGAHFGLVGIIVGTLAGITVCEVIPIAREVHLLPSDGRSHHKGLIFYLLSPEGLHRTGTLVPTPVPTPEPPGTDR